MSVRYLAATLVSIVNAIDPKRIVIGGGIAQAGKALFVPLGMFLDEYEWRPNDQRVEVVSAKLGDETGAIGSAKFSME